MKKIIFYTLAMVFVLALGAAYAAEGGLVLNNGVTVFSETGSPIMRSAEPEIALHNGVTDFSGKIYDTRDIDLVAIKPAMESEHAGGMRDEGTKDLINGVTVFSGYDSN